jgi:hypothetical protein
LPEHEIPAFKRFHLKMIGSKLPARHRPVLSVVSGFGPVTSLQVGADPGNQSFFGNLN